MTKPHPMDVNTNTRIRWERLRRLPELANLEGALVLDVGAGLGFFSARFAAARAQVLSIDLDAKALDYLSREHGVATRVVDIANDPLPAGPFDLIFVGEVLEHLSDPAKLVGDAAEALAPGGSLIITVPALEGALIHTKGKNLAHDHGTEKHEREGFTKGELAKIAQMAGLGVRSHCYCLFYLSELFMQLTKFAYLRKKREYNSQSDITDTMRSLPYKSLRLVFPLLMQLFRVEEAILSRLGHRGHCHVMVCSKV